MGIGYASFTVTEFNFRASRQNLTLQGLTINVTGEYHGDVGASSITSWDIIRSISLLSNISLA